MAQMKPNSVAVFNSNDILSCIRDSVAICTAPRHLLLKWADQEESILLLFIPYEHQREMIFLKETNHYCHGKGNDKSAHNEPNQR
jgi:Xaa-Pro aminopeptidase